MLCKMLKLTRVKSGRLYPGPGSLDYFFVLKRKNKNILTPSYSFALFFFQSKNLELENEMRPLKETTYAKMTPQQSKKIAQFHQKLKNNKGPKLDALKVLQFFSFFTYYYYCCYYSTYADMPYLQLRYWTFFFLCHIVL